jgi:methionyl-tRNA formyltransferase
MLRQILSAGFVPTVVISEDSAIGDEEREKFLARIAGNPIAPSIEEQLAQLERCGPPTNSTESVESAGSYQFDEPLESAESTETSTKDSASTGIIVSHVTVPIHNTEHLLPHIQDLDLDLIVFGGTRIIRGQILDHPHDGVINSHPGLLPDCRGSASPAWSVYHDIPIGASTHFCDNGIDTGELLLRREFPVRRGMTYEDLCYATLVLAGVLMKEALLTYVAGEWPQMRRAQGESKHPTFRNAPEEVLEVVRTKLAEQTYAHYVD